MLVTIRTLNSQRKITASTTEELDQKIRDAFKTDTYQLFLDAEHTKPMAIADTKDGTTLFMSYNMGEAKTFKEEFKCTHSPDAVCPNCVNVDAVDKAITPGQKVKYFSYLSYVQALKDQSKRMDVYEYALKPCETHPANQKCMKCMDKQITLAPQPYRYIDYVEFDTDKHVEAFIADFRSTGRQQMGLLLGKVLDYDHVPMGKKAVVSAVWKVHQESFPDGVIVNELPNAFYYPELCVLGVIYTDLLYKNKKLTSSKFVGGYEISTLEIDFIASLAIKYNNPEFFGVCVSVNQNEEIEPCVFMVSEQYKALIRAHALSITTDPTHFMTERDVVYFVNNEYNRTVSKKADPLLPLWYFILTCPVGFCERPMFAKHVSIRKPNASRLASYFQKDYSFDNFKSFDVLCMLHALVPSITTDLFRSVLNNDEELFNKTLATSEFENLKNTFSKTFTDKWNCSQCTYLNDGYKSQCDICTFPKQ